MRFKSALAFLCLFTLVLTGGLPALAGDNPFVVPPPFKSAIIKYTYSGNQKGHSTVYYKGQVMAEHKQVETKVLGFGSEDKLITITTPKRVTTVDLNKNEASYTGNPMAYMAQEYAKLSPAEKKRVKKNAEDMGRNFMSLMGGQPKITKGTFLNRPVDIITTMGLTTYSWQGKHVVLKQQGSIMGMDMNMAATDVSVGVPVPRAKLEVPAGMTAVFNQEADQQQRMMAKRIMDNLKDPNFGKKQNQAMRDAKRQAAEAQAEAQRQQQGQPQGQEQQGDAVQQGLDAVKKIFKW